MPTYYSDQLVRRANDCLLKTYGAIGRNDEDDKQQGYLATKQRDDDNRIVPGLVRIIYRYNDWPEPTLHKAKIANLANRLAILDIVPVWISIHTNNTVLKALVLTEEDLERWEESFATVTTIVAAPERPVPVWVLKIERLMDEVTRRRNPPSRQAPMSYHQATDYILAELRQLCYEERQQVE